MDTAQSLVSSVDFYEIEGEEVFISLDKIRGMIERTHARYVRAMDTLDHEEDEAYANLVSAINEMQTHPEGSGFDGLGNELLKLTVSAAVMYHRLYNREPSE